MQNRRVSLQVVVDFQVLDEGPEWLVVDKPAPLIVHPANRKPEPTLLGGVSELLCYEIANGEVPAVVNRLDRETSGVVMIAKTKSMARELGMVFERRAATKTYHAIAHGWPQVDTWVSTDPIARAGEVGASKIWVRQIVDVRGRDCATGFDVLRRIERAEGKFSLIECRPRTGRMHQIRVHLAAAGHPIVGDKLYLDDGRAYLEWMEHGWTAAMADRMRMHRQALHASSLALPLGGKQRRWQAPLPPEFDEFLAGGEIQLPPGLVNWSRHDYP